MLTLNRIVDEFSFCCNYLARGRANCEHDAQGNRGRSGRKERDHGGNSVKALIQRVDHASVSVGGEVIGQIGEGLLALVGAGRADTSADADALARKVVGLRIFPDDDGRFNRSLIDVGGAMLVVSQFTLYADVRRGRRPSFTEAARPEQAERLVDEFVEAVRSGGVDVATGRFGAMMEVDLRNNGPFTLMVETTDGRVV